MPPGYRAIVADNGSTDASAAIAAEWGALVVPAAPRGFGAACHAGLLAATADIVCFMDADASLDPADLPRVVSLVADAPPDAGLDTGRPIEAAADRIGADGLRADPVDAAHTAAARTD